MSRRISAGNRIIPAVRKHIIPQEALAGAAVGIGVEKALNDGVIISALEIIEAGFRIVVVSAVAQGVVICNAHIVSVPAAGGQNDALCVVAVPCIDCFALIVELHHISLGIQHIMEGDAAGQGGIVIVP